MAISAIRAAEARGLRVPEDISIMGCDYSATYAELGYNLTSIEISLHDIARAALRSVVGIDAKRKRKWKQVYLAIYAAIAGNGREERRICQSVEIYGRRNRTPLPLI